jgi:2-dehydro-3-deoxygluconokinase
MQIAKTHSVVISYDLNYRESLWKVIGGKAKAREVNSQLVSNTDVLIGNEEDFSAALGVELEGVTRELRCCCEEVQSVVEEVHSVVMEGFL